jgi:hypothetical protein
MKRDFLSDAQPVQEKIEIAAYHDFTDEETIFAASDLRRNIYPLQKIPIDLAQLTSMAGVIAVAISLIIFSLLKR